MASLSERTDWLFSYKQGNKKKKEEFPHWKGSYNRAWQSLIETVSQTSKFKTPWVLCWHIRICHYVATPLSAVLTYTYMSWYYLWGNLHKIGSSKDFWWTFFCLLAVLQRNPLESKQKTLQQYFIQRIIPPLDKKGKKHQKLSTLRSSFDLNVSSQGVKVLQMF